MWCTFLLFTLFVTVQGRAVNISNTWVLPEEGFPVFYRYFKDRISWYEADAVCQFHHANLVTVDTTAQYDAVRAYLKELDISSAVWVGLIRSNPDGDFTWTDYRGLSGDGYWSAAPDTRSAPLCAAADPVSDYRWEARACGGPSVASFICELPVPQWALGNEGCMVRELPALTILYLPESAAVQLTADCGLAGVKRVQCTGSKKREDLLKELSCAVEDQETTLSSNTVSDITWKATTDVTFTSQDSNNEPGSYDFATTEHEDEFNQSMSIESTPIFQNSIIYTPNKFKAKNSIIDKNLSIISADKSIAPEILDNNNVHSNEISKVYSSNDMLSNDQKEKGGDEENLQHRKLHDELARLGNLETIFSQTTDHFIPPLVMAKAKISDDMIALSVEEKLAQQIADHQFKKKMDIHNISIETESEDLNNSKPIEDDLNYRPTFDDRLIKSPLVEKLNIENSKNVLKHSIPKKYNKDNDSKGNAMKKSNIKHEKRIKSIIPTESNIKNDIEVVNVSSSIKHNDNQTFDDTSIELSITLKESEQNTNDDIIKSNKQGNNIKIQSYSTEFVDSEDQTTKQDLIMNNEVIKIVVFQKNNQSHFTPTLFEITTKMPDSNNESLFNNNLKNQILNHKNESYYIGISMGDNSTSYSNIKETTTPASTDSLIRKVSTTEATTATATTEVIDTQFAPTHRNIHIYNTTNINDSNNTNAINEELSFMSTDEKNISSSKTEWFDGYNNTNMESTPGFDDFQSPLLSAANEPLHKPNRARRPQPSLNRANKFNPFRILG